MQELIRKMGLERMGKIANFLLFLEPRCLWCYRTKANIEEQEKNKKVGMVFCDECSGASYCCAGHMEKGRNMHRVVADANGQTQVSPIVL